VANSEDMIPLPKDTIRGETIYNLGIMTRDPDDKNKVKFKVLT
jgi:hypothetical protein